jgi:hypothetical protein
MNALILLKMHMPVFIDRINFLVGFITSRYCKPSAIIEDEVIENAILNQGTTILQPAQKYFE